MSLIQVWERASRVVAGHNALLVWWGLSGLSRLGVGLMGLMVGFWALAEVAGGGFAGMLGLWDRRAQVLGDVWLTAGIAGIIATSGALCVAMAAFFDGGFYGYISKVLIGGERGGWGTLLGEALTHWRKMIGWSARRLWWRGVMWMLLFVLGSLLLNAGSTRGAAAWWALSALCLATMALVAWMWRVRTVAQLHDSERSLWAKQRTAAREVLQHHQSLLKSFGLVVMAALPGLGVLVMAAALVGQLQRLWPSGGLAMALMLDVALLGLVALADVLGSMVWMSQADGALTATAHASQALTEQQARTWQSPLPTAFANIFKIREILHIDLGPEVPQEVVNQALPVQTTPSQDPISQDQAPTQPLEEGGLGDDPQ